MFQSFEDLLNVYKEFQRKGMINFRETTVILYMYVKKVRFNPLTPEFFFFWKKINNKIFKPVNQVSKLSIFIY